MKTKLFSALALGLCMIACSEPETPTAVPSTTASTATANISVVNTIPDGSAVDVLFDNSSTAITSVDYLESSAYTPIPAGGSRQVRLTSAGSTVRVANFAASTNKNYTFFAINKAAATKTLFLTVSDNLAAPAAGKANVRFLHLSPDGPEVRVTDVGAVTEIFSKRKFAATSTGSGAGLVTFTNFSAFDAGTYDFEVRNKPNETDPEVVVLTLEDVVFEEGKIYTIYARGLVAGAGDQALGGSIIQHN